MIAAHSDWSVDKRKRWITIGRKVADFWVLDAPQPTGDVSQLVGRLAKAANEQAVILGIDCPIGLPGAYAKQIAGFSDFPTFLKSLGRDDPFFQVAETIDEVCLARPFFPKRSVAGPGFKLALAKALKLPDVNAMSRLVDRKTVNRPAAGQLFWTLGANQCGKAALAAWRDLLIPAFAAAQIRLWPFEGDLLGLAVPGQVVVAETYPAEALRQLGLRLTGSKRAQTDRQSLRIDIRRVMEELKIKPSDDLASTVDDGFGSKPVGEDAFDSLIGALGVIGVLEGQRPDAPPGPVDMWEGWVLGQTDLPVS
jgi:hypothetical protein